MNADSLGFFDTQAELFVKKKAPIEGHDKIKTKLDWMFNRITLDEAKKEARPSYKLWIAELNKLKSSSNGNQ